MAGAHTLQPPFANVRHAHIPRRPSCVILFCVHHRAAQTYAHGISIRVKLAVIGLRCDNILRRNPSDASWNQRPHQQPGNRGVAIGKMKNVRLSFFLGAQSQSIEPCVGK